MSKKGLRIIFLSAAVLWAAVIFCVSAVPASGLPDNLGLWSNAGHFSEYILFAALLTPAVYHPSRNPLANAIIIIVIASLYGVSDELHQLFVDGRVTDIFDWMTDTAGAIVGTATASLIIFIRKRQGGSEIG